MSTILQEQVAAPVAAPGNVNKIILPNKPDIPLGNNNRAKFPEHQQVCQPDPEPRRQRKPSQKQIHLVHRLL